MNTTETPESHEPAPLLGLGSSAWLGAWLPIETAPRDGTSFLVPPQAGYTHCFWMDGFWWWHTVHADKDGDYAVGPEPACWQAPNVELSGHQRPAQE